MLCLLAATFFHGANANAVAAGQIDDFEDGTTQGWVEGGASPNPPTNVDTGGPAGANDHFLQNIASGSFGPGGKLVNINQVQWTGDYLGEGIVEIRAQVKLLAGTEVQLRAGFRGAGECCNAGWVSTSSVQVTNNGQWNEVVFSVAEADLTNTGSSQSYQQTMSDVAELRIFHSAGPSWNGGPEVSVTLGLDNIEAVGPAGQQYQGWLWDYEVRKPFVGLGEEFCFGQISLEIFDDDTWLADGEDVCWGRDTYNNDPARSFFNFDGTSLAGTETFEAQSTRPLVTAGGNLLELYGEDVEMGAGQGEGRLATVLADPDDGDLLLLGGYNSEDIQGNQYSSGFVDVLVKANPAVSAARAPSDLYGRWRISQMARSLVLFNNPNFKYAGAKFDSVLLEAGNVCTFEVSSVYPESFMDTNSDSYAIFQTDVGASSNLTDRAVDAADGNIDVTACTWNIDADGYLALSYTASGAPVSARKVISDDNNYLANAPALGALEENPIDLSVGYRAPSAILESDLDGNFLFYLNFTDFDATGLGHSQLRTGDQEYDGFGRGLISFDSSSPVAAPAGQAGNWFACAAELVISEVAYQTDGEPAAGTVTTSMRLSSGDIAFSACAFNLSSDGSMLVNFTITQAGDPDEEILFAGYANNTGDVLSLLDFVTDPDPLDPVLFEDSGSVRQIIAMRYTGDPAANDDGDELTNLEEFQFPLPPPPPFTDVLALTDVNSNGTADIGVLVPSESGNFVQVRDGSDDSLIVDISFGSDPVFAAVVIDDINANGAQEIAVLGLRPSGQVRVQVNDGLTGASINTIFYGNQYLPVDMAAVPDTTGNNAAELAVFAQNASGGLRVQARDSLTDAESSTTFYGSNSDPVDVQVLPDINANSFPEIVVHSRITATGQTKTQIRDSDTGQVIRQIFFGSAYDPLHTAVVNDVSGDALPDLAQLGRRSDTGAVRVQIKATSGGPVISNAFLGSADLPVETIAIGDVNASGWPDTATLVQRPDGTGKVILRDGLTGDFIQNIFFGAIDNPAGLTLVDDLNASGSPELAALGYRNGVRRVQIRDSVTGANINTIDYQ